MPAITITVAPTWAGDNSAANDFAESLPLDADVYDYHPWEEWRQNDSAFTLIAVDAHASFARMCGFFTDHLPACSAMMRDKKATIAFVSPTAMTLSRADASDPDQYRVLKYNSFFIKMVRSYRWGRLTRIDFLQSLLGRLQAYPDELFRITRTALSNWKEDIHRLWCRSHSLASQIDGDLKGREEIPNSQFHGLFGEMTAHGFLGDLATVYLYGRVDQDDAEKLVSKRFHWLKKQKGFYHLQEQKRRLSDQAKGERLPSAALYSRGYEATPSSASEGAVHDNLRHLVILASKRLQIDAKMKMLEYLRDFANCLSRGTPVWAAESKLVDNEPIKVLAIKDYVRQDKERAELEESFKHAFGCAFRPGDITLECHVGPKDIPRDDTQRWDTYEWWRRAVVDQRPINVTSMVSSEALVTQRCIFEYDIILIEMEYRTRFVGTSIVQWLATAFDELDLAAKECRAQAGQFIERSPRRPQIIALSRNEKPGHGYTALSHGAEAFAHKSRIYAIPALLTCCRVGRRHVLAEPRYSRPNYRVLYGLLPDIAGRLHSRQADELILGDEWDSQWIAAMPKADLHYHIGTSITLSTIGSLAMNTAGYAIAGIAAGSATGDKSAIGRLLCDVSKTVLLANLAHELGNTPHQSFTPQQALWGAARFIRVPHERDGSVVRPHLPEKNALEQVIAWLTAKDRPFQTFEVSSLLVSALFICERGLAAVQHSGAKSKYIDLMRCPSFQQRVVDEMLVPWTYFSGMSSVFETDENIPLLSTNGDPRASALGRTLISTLDYYMRRAHFNWKHVDSRGEMEKLYQAAHSSSATTPYRLPKWWGEMFARVKERTELAVRRLCEMFGELLAEPAWLTDEFKAFTSARAEFMLQHGTVQSMTESFVRHAGRPFPGIPEGQKSFRGITFRELVTLPDTVAFPDGVRPGDRSLSRYLWGAGLLGAEHLQFPENLLLAAFDIVGQNVRDNVVYSEVRCATNGYCSAGLSASDATDILCLGFDIAATFFGWVPPSVRESIALAILGPPTVDANTMGRIREIFGSTRQRWVRTNVLLGAKRHKDADEFAEIVSLVRHYLERGREPGERFDVSRSSGGPEPPGAWWSPCAVVGFDLSGDETREFLRLRERVEPLFVVSAPITIHAGEAATAESIWDAVYSLGAQRIGHGLRLRDDQKLLQFCSRRGICMELCPISNAYTNMFNIVEKRLSWACQSKRDIDDSRSVYPLRAFLNPSYSPLRFVKDENIA